MPTPTSRLRAVKLDPGGSLNVWGDLLNTQALDLIDEAIAGVEKISLTGSNGSLSLTSANYATDQARNAALIFTGAPAVDVTVTIPSVEKVYVCSNQTARTVTLTAGGLTVALAAGDRAVVWCDGTDCGLGSISATTVTGLIANAQLAGANLPGQAGNAGKFLQTDGSVPVWSPIAIPDVGGGADATITTSVTLASNASVVQSVNMATDAQSVKLPAATSLTKGGRKFVVLNVGNRTHGIRDNAGTLLTVVPAGGAAELHLRDNSTAAGSWGVTGRGLEPALTLVDHTAPTTVANAAEGAVRLTDTLSIHFGSGASGASFYGVAVDSTPGAGAVGTWTLIDTALNAWAQGFRISDTQAIVFWVNSPANKAAVLTVDPTTRVISVGAAASTTTAFLSQVTFSGRPVLAQLTPTLYVSISSTVTGAVAVSVSGTTVTIGAASGTGMGSMQLALGVYPVTATTALALWVDGTNPYNLKAAVLSVSGATISVGSANTVSSLVSNVVYPVCQLSAAKYVVGHSDNSAVKASLLTVSGTSVSASSPANVETVAVHPNALWHNANRFQSNMAALDANRALLTYGPDQGVPGVQTRHVVLSESGGALTVGNIIYSLFASISGGGATGGNFPQTPAGFLAFSSNADEQAVFSVTINGTALDVTGTFADGGAAFNAISTARFGLSGGVAGILQSSASITGSNRPTVMHLFRFRPNAPPQYLGAIRRNNFGSPAQATYITPVEVAPNKVAFIASQGLTQPGATGDNVRLQIVEFAQ